MTLPRLVVDLRRLRANIREVQRRSAPAEVMMIVKCDAYGHGLERVVTAAAAEGVRWFGAFDSATAVRARRRRPRRAGLRVGDHDPERDRGGGARGRHPRGG
ncbi:alanine racemase [Microbacterium sp. NPDC060132]|uniref:alanine racemase n=1 Tax=unclassified Microbacterium TaxID=2609290 RepID=UPI0036645C21